MLHVLGCITEQHDLRLVALAAGMCFFACLTAMSMIGRARVATGRVRLIWLGAAGLAAGSGIWATHFVAMLAYRTNLPVGFDLDLTVLSAVIAIILSAIGYWLCLSRAGSIVGGAVVGLAIGAMHYIGMAAVRMPADAIWQPSYVAASLFIGMMLTPPALVLANRDSSWRGIFGGTGLFTLAIVGMHFTGMAALSYRPNPQVVVSNAPIAPLALAAAVAATAFLILCLAMVCVFVDRRFAFLAEREAEALRAANGRLREEIEERQAVAGELLTTNMALTNTQSAIRSLLDNADQGFLTITQDLLVCEQSSAACEAIFGQAPAGLPIVDLLCPGASPDLVSNMRVTLESVFSGPSGYIRELKLELLPTAFALDGKSIKAGYKALADGRLMFILTDVTETMRLSEEVERERRRLEMIVLAFTESEAFSALVDEYREFLTSELPALLERIGTPGAPGELYRHLHTYKGLLAQFSFYHSPPRLHDFETALSEDKVWTAEAARTIFAPEALLAELERDLASLGGGQEFTGARRRFVLSQGQLQSMRQTAKETLAGERVLSPLLHQLLQTLAGLGGLDVKSALALHGRGASSLAVRLEKELAPIQIDGDATSLPPERYGDFLRSLVHVFRNAVDHGIEAPEVRAQAGKPIEGTVRCDVSRRGDRLEIAIEDDGCGVNRAVLEDKLIASDIAPSQVKAMSLKDLVFWEGLSSRDAANHVSGRGIGLAAVKTELDRLGGSVTVENGRHSGARFCFQLPIESEDSGSTVLELMTA
jgi:NO-binding membrane sensor protein with MHYT domain